MPPVQPEETLHVCGPLCVPVQAPGMCCREQNVEPRCRQVRATEEREGWTNDWFSSWVARVDPQFSPSVILSPYTCYSILSFEQPIFIL